MKLRFGIVVGFTIGYYLGAMAGRERYQQLNRMINKARKSTPVDMASDKARSVVDLGMEKAKEGVQHTIHHNGSNTPQPDTFSPS